MLKITAVPGAAASCLLAMAAVGVLPDGTKIEAVMLTGANGIGSLGPARVNPGKSYHHRMIDRVPVAR